MQSAKTLWILDVPYKDMRGSVLLPLYAEDEQEAWIEAQRWALQRERTLPKNATLVHFPRGVHSSYIQYAPRTERGKHMT